MSGGSNEEGDLSAVAWPGFVDILSSVLIMFVFFLMLTAVALNFHTIMFKSKLEANNDKVIKEKVEEQMSQTSGGALKIENDELKKELAQAEMKAQMEQEAHVEAQRELATKLKMLQQSAQMAESEEQKLKMLPAENTIYVFYGADAISLTEASVADIETFIKENGAQGMTIRVEASFNTTNKVDQTARRVAVARMLNARNVPLRLGTAAANIKATLVDGQEVDGQLDWVRIVLEKK